MLIFHIKQQLIHINCIYVSSLPPLERRKHLDFSLFLENKNAWSLFFTLDKFLRPQRTLKGTSSITPQVMWLVQVILKCNINWIFIIILGNILVSF